MRQEVGCLRLALRYTTNVKSYPEIRETLREKAWKIARAGVARDLFCAFWTFPGWDLGEQMLDFDQVKDIFPVTDFGTICLSVQPSPIEDQLAGSILDLLPEDLVQEAQSFSRGDPWTDPAIRSRFLRAVSGSPVGNFVTDCFADAALSEGIVLYGQGMREPAMISSRPEVAARLLCHMASRGDDLLLLRT